MTERSTRRNRSRIAAAALALLVALPAFALQPRQTPARFDGLVRVAPNAGLASEAKSPESLPHGAAPRAAWDAFVAEQNGGWQGWIDQRSGLPMLAQGRGIPWVAGRGNSLKSAGAVTVAELEKQARAFIETHPRLLGQWGSQLVLDPAASGKVGSESWQVTFRQSIGGVPVEGARYNFQVSNGNLVAFGASSIATVTRSAKPAIGVGDARAALDSYLGVRPGEVTDLTLGLLHLIPVDPRGAKSAWDGAIGSGYSHALAWRFEFRVPNEPARWVAEVDADNGQILALYDDTRYDRIKGGIYPVSDDGKCPTGCEQPDFPMPFADYTENGGPVQAAGSQGLYNYSTLGSTIRTTLAGPYVRVDTSCGAVNESIASDADLDLVFGAGTDCVVPPGHSAGDTHSARSSFYHLNRVMEKGRAWLPTNTWLQSQLRDTLDIFSTCNAYWDGSGVNFYRSGGGCRNTGEIAGVFVHEWGHGIDNNDGGGYDNPSEAYADTVAFFETRESCIGRGFFADDHNCGGYGDACLNCSGIRDQDWDMHAGHAPATAAWAQAHCGGGGGPCGYEPHCEAYISSEAIWDLAVRDMPASGMDAASSWQHTEQLWYLSRNGSGGNAYNCSGTNSDGCNSDSWFHKFRVADDDDGNLNNGTPHAAAIFAAFKRHGIACGNVSDASNQSSSSCPSIAKPNIGVTAGSNSNTVNWNSVANAASYRVLRNDLGCERAQIIVGSANAPATSFTDTGLGNNFTLYYRVQALGANGACVSPVSDCVSSAAQPFAGSVRFDHATFGCSVNISLRVTDGNVPAPGTSVTVDVWSDSETTPETITLTQAAPGSASYIGFIPSTSGPAVHGDGLLSIKHNDTIHALYVDADDGQGGTNLQRTTTAIGDCVYPVITNVGDTGTTDTTTTIQWATDESSDTVLVWGPVKPPANTGSGNPSTTTHQVSLGGLQQCTIYWYEVHSTDPAGNVAIGNNGGNYFHFETQGIFGGTMQPCHQGRLTLSKSTLACTDSTVAQLVDIDLNTNPNVAETVTVYLSSTTETQPEKLVLTETGPNTSTFTGTANVAQGAPVANDGIVQIANGDTFTATYHDGNDGTGAVHISFATAIDDCAAPQINPVQVIQITDDAAKVQFTTSEPSTGRVEWGFTSALGTNVYDNNLSTSHTLPLGVLNECGRVYFRVYATDVYGNTRVMDRAGVPFEFNAYIIPGIFRDNFETSTGWTLNGEWQIASPAGKGSSPGDPLSAFTGTKVLGEDLTGLGAKLGDYELHTDERAISPVINATSLAQGQLKFRRWLNVGGGAIAYIEVKNGSVWQPVFTSNSVTGVTESAWGLQTVDISKYADHNGSLQIAFRTFGGPGSASNRAGWNVDRFVVHSGAGPDYDVCGSCGGTPTFGGVQSAVDTDACANSGVTLGWKAAPAWGTGHAGTYTIWRSTTPNFTPSDSNRIAAGVAGTSYSDVTAPDGATLYYLVRAENDETCSTGANNHGATDNNTVYASVSTTSSRPLPAAITNLAVNRVNLANVRLTWPAAAGAASYRTYRSINPIPGNFGRLAETAGLFQDDTGAGADFANYFYLVRGANPCGNETP